MDGYLLGQSLWPGRVPYIQGTTTVLSMRVAEGSDNSVVLNREVVNA